MPDYEDRSRGQNDLLLPPQTFAWVLDMTKGTVSCYVGPTNESLSGNTHAPVILAEDGSFEKLPLGSKDAVQKFHTAGEGNYLVLGNPVQDENGALVFPRATGSGADTTPFHPLVGETVIIPGPISIPLWPGQKAAVVEGHRLRSNQYLVVRVVDPKKAAQNWPKAVSEEAEGGSGGGVLAKPSELTTGQLLIISGKEVSFYIPPTGIEVLMDDQGGYVREAVTLEQMEYCILLDESGTKRFTPGPDVVFPSPTETFVVTKGKDGTIRKKYRALELNDQMGVYVKVTTAYTVGDRTYKEGEELFITGTEQRIYFPREEHSIIKYEGQLIHYAIAIPEGSARYVLDKNTGKVEVVEGPCMFLPDPRHQVIVKWALSPKQVELWFPGNQEALDYNEQLSELAVDDEDTDSADLYSTERLVRQALPSASAGATRAYAVSPASGGWSMTYASSLGEQLEALATNEMQRKTKYTPPRTIQLDERFEGAVRIEPFVGYAVMVVYPDGRREVHEGPDVIQLPYGSTLQALSLSSGTPKTDKNPVRTVYLQAKYNTVSDIVNVETLDLVNVAVRLSYRVNFEGEPKEWFNTENYTGFLTDHLRSMIRGVAKGVGVKEFNDNAIRIIRDAILGVAEEGSDRPGRKFSENGMRVYDIEILDIVIGDQKIAELLKSAERETVQGELELQRQQRNLVVSQQVEEVKRKRLEATAETTKREHELEEENVARENKAEVDARTHRNLLKDMELVSKMEEQETLDQIAESERLRKAADEQAETDMAAARLAVLKDELNSRTEAFKAQVAALDGETARAIISASDKDFASKLAEHLGPLGILGGKDIIEVFQNLVGGVPALKRLLADTAKPVEPAE